tara:strand:- start:6555 stop:6845 length:291 start_codon:yes stop_codon:yes gene_type:complete
MKEQFNDQLKNIFMACDVPEADAIKAAKKITDDVDSHDPLDYAIGSHDFELCYRDFSITQNNGSWWFSDNTKDLNLHDYDIISGLMTVDAMRRQGL